MLEAELKPACRLLIQQQQQTDQKKQHLPCYRHRGRYRPPATNNRKNHTISNIFFLL